MSYSNEAMGRVILVQREAAGLTQEQLGIDAGYGAGAGVSISRVEAGLTRPSAPRLDGIADALGTTAAELMSTASAVSESPQEQASNEAERPQESLRDRYRRVEEEVRERTNLLEKLGEDFNEAHDRARDEFFMPFVGVAALIDGAPQPDASGLGEDEPDADEPEVEAAEWLRMASFGIANALAGTAGGAAAGAAVGGAAAYGTFTAAVWFGTASTGAAISGLSGVAASNAALAFLGGGTLAAGGAGMAGGAMLLAGMVAVPALFLAIGGLVLMNKRSRAQQQELATKLDVVEADLRASRPGYEALISILPRATKILDYIAVHAGHAFGRWEHSLDAPPRVWKDMTTRQQRGYTDFVEIAASQIAVVSVPMQDLMTAEEAERERLIAFADEVLLQADNTVTTLV